MEGVKLAPKQKPGRSKQDYATPPEFIDAVCRKLGIVKFGWDLAANRENAITHCYHGPGSPFGEDSLQADWSEFDGWMWLNPPYSHITPWVEKAWAETRFKSKIAMLIPASVGANWWADNVHNAAHVLFLNGRLSFDGKAPYPKDCALLLYTPYVRGGYEVWDWRHS
jgi:phage N-6-adenine-methyltransferase